MIDRAKDAAKGVSDYETLGVIKGSELEYSKSGPTQIATLAGRVLVVVVQITKYVLLKSAPIAVSLPRSSVTLNLT